ncbi:MSCRAMM family protein [Marinigracilibium pacificum]|uniref:Carboxypeptidase regulatory-like domain-containing protein n=1 Tax=Marinigracilibium pacificum TaxID=2729599 RepID=A0A848J9E7_9BACT|nr:carboxypeptidase regulatory-like domain-containing protein [Marinigracilibium pacificum]NMM49672.1 hypothetical protein [Marinigracilibium pacificum]
MSTIINNYPVFEDSQVLTSGQLNQIIKYLDQQNRLTRVALIGMGIVCGMKLSCKTEDSKSTLTISKGVGVTSEGFLIGIGNCPTTRYREYVLPDTVSYPPFEHEDLKLYELLTETALTQPEEVVTDLDESFLSDKVVVLYLECFDKDLKSCLGKSCDELGIDRIFTLRKLLISKDQLENLVWPLIEGGKSDASYPEKNLLPPYLWKRPLMDSEVDNYYEMGVRYLGALASDSFLPMLSQTYDIYEPVLSEVYGENPFTSSVVTDKISKIIDYVSAFLAMEEPIYGVQYLYDFVKDLGLAYNEFRDVSFELSSVCCPDMDRFPKHLMLGEACGSEEDVCIPLKYRNEFVGSPIISGQKDLVEKVRFLHKRMVLIIESFDLDRLVKPVEWPLKITPSCEKKGTLSQRTIPIYYDSKKESEFDNLSTLENTWNFEVYRRCYESDFPKQLSYDNHEFDKDPEHPISTPLGFELDQFNFLRIEGILAKSVEEVKSQILEAKSKWNLSFDVKAIHFGELQEKGSIPDCLIADLQPDYSIWRNKLLLVLNNLVRANKSVEEVVLNRKEYSATFDEMSNKKKSSEKSKSDISSFAGSLFDMQNFANISEEKLDFNNLSKKVFEAEIKLAGASKRAKVKRSVSVRSAEDTSLSGLFSDLNNCLLGLIQAMPVDFKDFSMEEWLSKYKCAMRVYIELMKFLSTRATSNVLMVRVIIILLIMCLLFDVIKFLAIYPYITIRTLYDTLQERIDLLAKSLEFSNFQKDHPGMEHKAGVAPGDTFILVYQAIQRDFGKIDEKTIQLLETLAKQPLLGNSEQGLEIKMPDAEQMIKVINAMEGTVVADFTLPFICCDDCSNLPHTPLTLDPLVTPICGVVGFEDKKLNAYRVLQKRVLNNLYDPSVYKVSLLTNPKLGNVEFTEKVYYPDPTKLSQILNYTVEPKLIEEEKKLTESYILIDEFEYQVTDVTRNEQVGKDKITIFIPIVRDAQASITGRVTAADASGNLFNVFDAKVSVSGTDLVATTNDDGIYEIPNAPAATFEMEAIHPRFGVDRKSVSIVNGENTIDFQLQPQLSVGVITGTVLERTPNGNRPVPGIVVSIDELGRKATTKATGDFIFTEVPYGTFKISTQFGNLKRETSVNVNQPNKVANIIFESDSGEGSIKGTVKGVTDENKEISLPGANIEIYGSETFKLRKGKPKYAGTTKRDGSYSIDGVSSGKYIVRASYNGYLSEEQSIDVSDKQSQSANFIIKASSKINIKYDRMFKAIEIDPKSPEAKKIEDYYSSRMGDYKLEAKKIKERLGGTEVTAITKANEIIEEISDAKDISVVKLNNEYNSIRNELVKGWENSSGEEKELHAEALQNMTKAYIERLAFIQPDNLTDTSKDVLKETGSLINDNEELNVKETIQNWLKNSEGYVNNDYRESVKRYLNIK